MIDLNKPFSIEYGQRTLQVEPRKIQSAYVYIIRFPDQTQPLVLTQAAGQDRLHFWTSIPEGRQKEAEMYGPLITAHIQAMITKP